MGDRPTGTRPSTWWRNTARFAVGDTQREAPARTLVPVPIGAEHTFANPGDEPAIILNTFTPDLYVIGPPLPVRPGESGTDLGHEILIARDGQVADRAAAP
jgi:hypothetical protein